MVEKVSETAREKILRKTPYAHSVRPSDDGMSAGQVKKMFYQAITDREDSVLAQVDRVVDEVNDELALKVDQTQVVDLVQNAQAGKIPSVIALINYCDNAQNTFRLYYTNIEVPTSSWQEDDTLEDFGYRAFVPLPVVTEAMLPEVFFSAQDASPGNGIGNICDTAEGGIYIYAMAAPQGTVKIDAIYLNSPNAYNVVVTASAHVHFTVKDQADVTYRNGDFVVTGSRLAVSWTVDDGYQATVKINHQQVATSPASVTVAGTVWIEGTEEAINEG